MPSTGIIKKNRGVFAVFFDTCWGIGEGFFYLWSSVFEQVWLAA